MKGKNKPLIIGSFLLGLIVLVMLFPEFFSPTNPYGLKTMQAYTDAGGSFVIKTPPYAPSWGYPLGSDEMGRDMLSLIIYGTRLTIGMSLLVVAARFMLSVPIGISAGLGSLVSRTLINQFSLVFSALPALLISLIILKMGFFTSLFKEQSMVAFVVVLSFVGWHETAGILSGRVEKLNAEAFIKGQRAIGKSDFSIAIQNILPHLSREIAVMFFMEIARVLTMLMQLGIFEVFVGNLRIIMSSGYGGTVAANVTFEPEWSSMLGASRLYLRSAPWIVFYPAMAFFISVLGFNLFGEGLKNHFQGPQGEKTGRGMGKAAINGMAAFMALVAVLFAYSNLFIPDFNLETTRRSLDMEKTGQLISGSGEAEKMAGQIASKLEEMGLKPVRGNTFLQTYEKGNTYVPIYDELILETEEGSVVLEAGEDYFADAFGTFDAAGGIFDGRRLDYYKMSEQSENFRGRWVMLDSRRYSPGDMLVFAEKLLSDSQAIGVLIASGGTEKRYDAQGDRLSLKPILTIDGSLAEILAKPPKNLSYRQVAKLNEGDGINILAKLAGKDPRIKDDVILIGLSYTYQYEPIKSGKIDFAFELIEQLSRKEANRDRTIMFAFFDGTATEDNSGIHYFSEHLPFQQKHLTMYLDLTKIYGETSGRILYNGEMAPLTRYYGWGFNRKMTKSLSKSDVPAEVYDLEKEIDSLLYMENGFTTIIAGFEPDSQSSLCLEDFGNILVKNLVMNSY